MAFEKEINDYENLRTKYQTVVVDRMDREEYRQFNEIRFSTHSCAIEGNSFSVDDTRELKEKGLGMIPTGKSLLEAFEMLDHFKAYEYVLNNTGHALDEAFLKEINRLVTLHTLAYRSPDATPGEYTTTDMAAGDTVFGDHEQLVAKVPQLLASTERAIASSAAHPVVFPWLLRVSAPVPRRQRQDRPSGEQPHSAAYGPSDHHHTFLMPPGIYNLLAHDTHRRHR